MRWLSRLVTVAVVLGVLAAVALVIRAKMPDTRVRGSLAVWAKFRDGSGLALGSPVRIAGVPIGAITRISIEGKFARVDMRLQDTVRIPRSAFITRRADSLFDDTYLEVILSGAGEGAVEEAVLASGDQLVHVIEGSSTDAVLRAIDRAMPRIEGAVNTVQEAMRDGRRVVNGRIVGSVASADQWLAAGSIDQPIALAHRAIMRVDDATTRGAEALAEVTPDVLRGLRRLEQQVADARGSVASARTRLATTMQDVRTGLDGIDPQLAQATEIMAAINNGEGDDYRGTLGRLVNDPELAESIEDATVAARGAVASFNQFKSWLGMRTEFNVFSRVPRIYATAEIRARTDKFYLVEFEKGGLGGLPSDQVSDSAGTAQYTRVQEIRESLRFTAQFGKQFGPLSIRGGIKDSTFGFGVDVLLMSGRLKLSNDVFGGFSRTPRLKVAAAFAVFRSIYVIAGVDDALATPGYLRINTGIGQDVPNEFADVRYGRDYFIGGALHFDDADLATLLRVYGALLAGALAF